MSNDKLDCLGGSLVPILNGDVYEGFDPKLAIPNYTISQQRLESYPPTTSISGVTSNGNSVLVEWNVPYSEGSYYNLSESFFECQIRFPAAAVWTDNSGPSPFFLDSMVTQAWTYVGSTLLSDMASVNTYPFMSLGKACLVEPEGNCLTPYGNNRLNTIEEMRYLHVPLFGIQASAANQLVSLIYIKNFIQGNGNTLYCRLRLADGIWLAKGLIPASNSLRIQLQLNLLQGLQIVANSQQLINGAVTMQSMNFNLKRVILTPEADSAFHAAHIQRPLQMSTLYARVETLNIPGTSTNFSGRIFQSQRLPQVIVFFIKNLVNDTSYPFIGCGYNATSTPISFYIRSNGRQIPFVGGTPQRMGVTSYQRYVDQCLDDEHPFLTYDQWISGVARPWVFTIDEDDEAKMYAIAPKDEQAAIDVYIQFSIAPGVNMTLYAVAFNNASVSFFSDGRIETAGYV